MRPVQIVTDGIADVPRDIASELDISIIPGRVFLKGKTYRDGTDLAPQAFCERLAASTEVPRTSQPPVGDFVQAYRRILDTKRGCEIVSIHIAGSLSGTVSSASAAKMLPDSESVEVIDTGQLSVGTGWVVHEAARMAGTGATRTEVRCFVDELLTRVRVTAMVDSLENLYKGERISQISTTLGTALQIKPLLTIKDGRIIAWGRVRTHARALKRIASQVRSWGRLAEMAVVHAGNPTSAQNLADSLDDLVPLDRILIVPAGSALTSHLGLGVVGVCALTAKGT